MSVISSCWRALKSYRKYPVGSTVLVHIGKCGGRTLKDGIEHAKQNADVRPIHVRKPPHRRDLKYIIVARNPISRAFSAFRWRYKLVVTRGSQRDRFPGEHDILVKYKTLNALAEALYEKDGSPNLEAHREFQSIHHLKENIAFYLRELLDECDPDQIISVLMQENLDEDIRRTFGYENQLRKHVNPAQRAESDLSAQGKANLVKYLAADFEALTRLFCWGKLDPEIYRGITASAR